MKLGQKCGLNLLQLLPDPLLVVICQHRSIIGQRTNSGHTKPAASAVGSFRAEHGRISPSQEKAWMGHPAGRESGTLGKYLNGKT